MRTYKLITTILAGVLASSASVQAQDGDLPYDSGSDESDGALIVPQSASARYHFANAYDAGSEEIVMFGGQLRSNSNVYPTETWVYGDGDGDGVVDWQSVEPDTFVSGRSNSEMVYDAERDVVVMFGGKRADGVELNDTWLWDGDDWTAANPTTSPPARHYHEMIWDSIGKRVLLFGGKDKTDLWSWDGTNWTELVVSDIKTIRAGYNSNYSNYDDMVFETSTGRAILFNEAWRETYALDLTSLTWSLLSTGSQPNVGYDCRLAYDEERDQIILAGGSSNANTWAFESGVWTQLTPDDGFLYSYAHGLVYDSVNKQLVRFFGYNSTASYNRTYIWDGTNWAYAIGDVYRFDMTSKADGIWNFTSIYVPGDTTVYFDKNAGNTPVVWLASEDVLINGTVNLNGQSATGNDQSGLVAPGGPGGFDGGLGGVRFDVSGSYLGTPGQGPGGGDAPTDAGQHGLAGRYNEVYGNRLIQPLIGGSGGSGASSSDNNSGGNGGGGGGAILLASSKDIELNGSITAIGGLGRALATSAHNSRYGGGGSGGAIRLVADRVIGSGSASAAGGDSYGTAATADGGAGRVRIEGFYRPIVPNASPVPSASAPVATESLTNNRKLWIANVAGEAVGNDPTGSLTTPDVVFTNAGTVSIVVNGDNIPSGTAVKLRITTSEGTINLPANGDDPVTLVNDVATFSTTVPAGLGSIQATAEFLLDN